MKKFITLIALLPLAALASPPEWAQNDKDRNNATAAQGQDQLQGQAQGQLQGQAQGNLNLVGIDVDNRVNSSSRSSAVSGSIAGAEQGQSQTIAEGAVQNSTSTSTATDQTQTATATNAGNAQSITFNEAKPLRTLDVRSVPTAIAPNVYPTASCAMSASVGASALGWGVSGGGTKVNEECMQLEAARMFSQLGFPVQGLVLACSTKSALAVYQTTQACLDASAASEPTKVTTQPVVRAEPAKVETTLPFGEAK